MLREKASVDPVHATIRFTMAPLRTAVRLAVLGTALSSSFSYNIQKAPRSGLGTRESSEFASYATPVKPPISTSGRCAPPRKVATDNERDLISSHNRREAIFKSLLVSILGVVLSTSDPAHATYSAYAHREQDWSERLDHGEIKFSSATSLKKQLREIAPMNNAKSELFCPNGPSSNVSPLMENKCGDRLAMPSVFGRSDDVVGNSIPGFKDSKLYYVGGGDGDGDGRAGASADVGGFLDYGSVNSGSTR